MAARTTPASYARAQKLSGFFRTTRRHLGKCSAQQQYKTEQYKSSFFVKAVADWNKLEDTVVAADSVIAFSSAVGRVLQGAASHT